VLAGHRRQEGAQRPGRPPLPANHPAAVVRVDAQLDDEPAVDVPLADVDTVRSPDETAGEGRDDLSHLTQPGWLRRSA